MNSPYPPQEPCGIECPKCGCRHFRVLYTRPIPKSKIMRKRECRDCGRRVVTYESPVTQFKPRFWY